MRATFALCLCGAGFLAAAAAAYGQQRSFVACPIIRDTKTAPCYLAESGGETYFLGTQQDSEGDIEAPQLKHQVLVEGTVAPGPRVCGGIPLRPVSISVLKEVDLACNTLLPAEPGIEAPAPSHATGSADHAPLTGKQEFTVFYPFDDDHPGSEAVKSVTEAAAYAKQTGAQNVKVYGYRGTSLLSNGERLTEKAGLAERRAQNIATLLRGLGVKAVTVEWKSEAEPGDGQKDPARRRVSIAVAP